MARPKHTNPEHFTSGEISHGTGISMRNLQVIRDNGLAPEGGQWLPSGLWDLDGQMMFALAGGLQGIGLPLLTAARISHALLGEFTDPSFGYMSGIARNPFGSDFEVWTPQSGTNCIEFWEHYTARSTRRSEYSIKQHWENDIIVWLADMDYVFLDIHTRLAKGKMAFGNHLVEAGPDPFCQLVQKPDTMEPSVLPLHERPEWSESDRQLDLFYEYRSSLENAQAAIRFNVSLTIRNSLDQIYDLRMSKGGAIYSN